MSTNITSFRFKDLAKSDAPAHYAIYCAALEWNLIEPIMIETADDMRSERLWRGKVNPFKHQVTNLITFCRRLPVTLLADDVGLGKTISAGLVASELMSRGKVSKILIVCPKLLKSQWKDELLTKFGISSIDATGTQLRKGPPEGTTALITTYQSAQRHFDSIAQSGYEMLILDEAHKLRNLYGTEIQPAVARQFRKALSDRLFKYVLMLTATPIQNRLWDIYSLVDLLTVARGHENPFGSEDSFARKFILDNRTTARHLNQSHQKEFRDIVYGYMSRFRRVDANLSFPTREIESYRVTPKEDELELFRMIAVPIQKIDRRSQISIAKALVSSPQALAAELTNRAKNQPLLVEVAAEVNAAVSRIQSTAKLEGLSLLIDKLKTERPSEWRMVVFTTRLETQYAIEQMLDTKGISYGLINGASGSRNQATIDRFRKSPPEVNLILSTDAGAEGVNLQVANVVVNYDLPWNPMTVEQRIGRVQRLASNHAKVCVFNMTLKKTFEEYIVGRLMQKLQMISHAIGDIEALLEAASLDGDEENAKSFEEIIRELVLASLAGKNIEEDTRLAEENIAKAQVELEANEQQMNSFFGGMNGSLDHGPRCPHLPQTEKSMDDKTFVQEALKALGYQLTRRQLGVYSAVLDGEKIDFTFEEDSNTPGCTIYRPGSTAFEKLIDRFTGSPIHVVADIDDACAEKANSLARDWITRFGGKPASISIEEVNRHFIGDALLRVRVTVAHDSYERLINTKISDSHYTLDKLGLEPIPDTINNPTVVGLTAPLLKERAVLDEGVSEFCRFYNERLTQEIDAAGQDKWKRKKLEDDLTPRVDISVVGLRGTVHRDVKMRVSYQLTTEDRYESVIRILPSKSQVIESPDFGTCASTGANVPSDCLSTCFVSKKTALKHLLKQSEISGHFALPEHTTLCELSNKRVLLDEIGKSDVTGKLVATVLMKTSAISGKKGEPQHFSQCEFTSTEVLTSETEVSQISSKRYRTDEQTCSAVSGKTGHQQEFISCSESGKVLLPSEAETCEITGKKVAPGILKQCDVTGKKVLASELNRSVHSGKNALKSLFMLCPETNRTILISEAEHCEVSGKAVAPGVLKQCEVTGKKVLASELDRCAVSGKKALKTLFVLSSRSGAHLLEKEAIQSAAGKFCSPIEAKSCNWSGRRTHPDDLRMCNVTGVPIHLEFMSANNEHHFEILSGLLDGTRRKADAAELWISIAETASKVLDGARCRIDSAELSPDSNTLAVCVEVKTLLGFKVRHAGLLYSVKEKNIVGRIAFGKRDQKGWLIKEAA